MTTKNSPANSAANQPTHESLAVCAYLLWEQERCPESRDVTHWLQSEAQLSQTSDSIPSLNPSNS